MKNITNTVHISPVKLFDNRDNENDYTCSVARWVPDIPENKYTKI